MIRKNENDYSVIIEEEINSNIEEIEVYTSSNFADAFLKQENLYMVKISGLENRKDFYETLCDNFDAEITIEKRNSNGIITMVIYVADNKDLSAIMKSKEYVFSIMKILK